MNKRSHLGALVAAASLFTRLPFWRLRSLTKEDYEDALSWWPVVGVLTALTLAGSYWLLAQLFSMQVALVLALGCRMILTGAFHEDGLGDFFDGFGGGHDRERVLAIMKDSHVGSYAVLGFVLYYLCYVGMAQTLLLYDEISTALEGGVPFPWVLVAADLMGKFAAQLQVQLLPYARREEQSKTQVVYRRTSAVPLLLGLALTLGAVLLSLPEEFGWLRLLALTPLGLSLLLIAYLRRRIGGYTGDTCGALCLLSELCYLASVLAMYALLDRYAL